MILCASASNAELQTCLSIMVFPAVCVGRCIAVVQTKIVFSAKKQGGRANGNDIIVIN